MQQQISKTYILPTIFILLIAIVLCHQRQNPSNYNTPHLLPKQLRIMLQTNTPQHWCILYVKNNKLSFFNNYSTQHWLKKQNSLQTMLEKIVLHNNIIPDGYYAISLEDGVHTEYPWPLLAFASDADLIKSKRVLLLPDFEALNGYHELFSKLDAIKGKYSWHAKLPIIFWRGNASGTEPGYNEFNFARMQFMRIAAQHPNIDAGFTKYPEQTSPALHEHLNQHFPIVKPIEPERALKYRYLMDIDGYSCSYSRMAWILYSDSLLFKHLSNKQQWYYNKLQAYVHFVPISQDFSDLEQQFNWAQNNPDLVLTIIKNAQQLAHEIFAPAAIEQATYQALLDYHSLTQTE